LAFNFCRNANDITNLVAKFLKGRKTMKTLSRSSFRRFGLLCMTATLVLLAAGIAHAGSIFTVTLAQVGPDVVATGSGTIDLTGLSSFGSAFASPELYPAHGILGTGPSGTIDQYTGSTGPSSFGPGFGGFPISTSGDSVFLEDFGLGIDVTQGYVSGTSLSSSATYAGTLASLNVTPGTYTWTWNSGANSFVLQVPQVPVPEPSSFLLVGIGLLAGLWLARKQLFGQEVRC
jgi:PEP-CTERM motif